MNRRLKSVYFQWADNYIGPPPRSFASNFQEHLENERYNNFNENWLQLVIEECGIKTEEEFHEQLSLIKKAYDIYANQQYQKRLRISEKKSRAYDLKHQKEGSLPF